MSSEPPFDHPRDHTRYGPPPDEQRSVPWLLTPSFKIGCGAVALFLLVSCCLFAAIEDVGRRVINRVTALEKRIDSLEHKHDKLLQPLGK